MSKYRRDDKTFREQITKLADAGLVLGSFKKEDYPAHIGQACSLYRARPCSECAEPASFNGVPAYVRTIEPLEIAPKGKLPEMVAGLIWWVPIIVTIGAVLVYFFGGAH